ncbi:hypothetical protein BJV74DRAFT_786087, partial [Russula compacta]
ILFIGGLFLIIAPQMTFHVPAYRIRLCEAACFLCRNFLVFLKRKSVAVIVEMFRFVNILGVRARMGDHHKSPYLLLSFFFPVILIFLRQLPLIFQFLNLPYICPVRHAPTLYLGYLTHSCVTTLHPHSRSAKLAHVPL